MKKLIAELEAATKDFAPRNRPWTLDEDEIILSKGHAAASLYSMLAEEGVLSEDHIHSFYKNDTRPTNKENSVLFVTNFSGPFSPKIS